MSSRGAPTPVTYNFRTGVPVSIDTCLRHFSVPDFLELCPWQRPSDILTFFFFAIFSYQRILNVSTAYIRPHALEIRGNILPEDSPEKISLPLLVVF